VWAETRELQTRDVKTPLLETVFVSLLYMKLFRLMHQTQMETMPFTITEIV